MVLNLKAKLKNREKIFGTTITNIKWTGILQLMKNDVLDFLLIDLEHGRFSTESAEEIFRMSNVLKIPVLARVTDKEYAYMSKIFDLGADGILVPRVETVKEAEKIIISTRFPPKGNKGCGGFSLLRNVDGIESFNSTKILLLQIESLTGIENLQKMIDLNEFEGVIVGPTDLSISMGIPLEYKNPLLTDAVMEVINICGRNQTSCGIFCDGYEEIQFWRQAGMNVIWTGSDIGFFKKAYDEMCEFIRKTN